MPDPLERVPPLALRADLRSGGLIGAGTPTPG